MQNYEVMLLVTPDLGEDGISEELKKVKNWIQSMDGNITFEDQWGMQKLAYRIKNQWKGGLCVLNFSITSEKLEELEKTLHLEKNILRYLLTKTPTKYEPKKYRYTLPLRRKKRETEVTQEVKTVQEMKPIPEEEKIIAPKKPRVKKAEESEETMEPKIEPKKEQPKLEDIEKRLESIIDNPDIKL